jgi:hypothetical protein
MLKTSLCDFFILCTRDVVLAILDGDDWKEALRNVFKESDGTLQTPVRLLIKDFPDVVQLETSIVGLIL